MTLNKSTENGKVLIAVEGRVDTTTSAELGDMLNTAVDETDEITLDMEKLVYISSAGLRVLLTAHKAMSKKGGFLLLKNVNPDIYEIFEITGFANILNI
ncbi:STAS domain-containing protein [Ruminococcus sp. NK3A76]|uniref:STAS domain-containing protein n=1 Tax=Ruminococcus sp. NK3A76 TaxID=877411 RepID=UPI00048E3F1A|nr:STAS domain-containing protein [Ruminococcus sp. NK3A76]